MNRITWAEYMREKILRRDGYKCVACDATTDLCISHIVPLKKGGSKSPDNLMTLCRTCVAIKDGHILTASQMRECYKIYQEQLRPDGYITSHSIVTEFYRRSRAS